MINEIRKTITIADAILIIFLLVVALFTLLLVNKNVYSKQVEISYHNKLITTVPLNKDRIVDIDEGIVIEIKDNKVRIKESTCKNKYCVKQAWSNSFPIICVPNEISVVIKSNHKEEMLITK